MIFRLQAVSAKVCAHCQPLNLTARFPCLEILYFPAAIDDGAGLDVCDDLEELWRVERDGEDDDEELVELDVVLGEERGEPELAVVADADVTLEAERNHFMEELVKGSKEAITESFKTFLLSFENHSLTLTH